MAAVTSPAATAAAPVAAGSLWATEVPEAGAGVGVDCAVVSSTMRRLVIRLPLALRRRNRPFSFQLYR